MGAWVTRPERPKGAKDEVKEARRAKRGPKGRRLEVGARRAPKLLVSYKKDISSVNKYNKHDKYYILEVKGPSGPQLLVCGPSGLLDFVLRALRALRPCDPRRCVHDFSVTSQQTSRF